MSISRNNSIWFKFLAVLLVLALLFTFVLPRPEAKAIALADDVVLLAGAAVCTMIAAGIVFTTSNTDVDSFGSFISGQINNFISSEGTGSVSDYASGISLNPNGFGLNVSDPTMRFLDRFFNWFKGEENLTSEVSVIRDGFFYDGEYRTVGQPFKILSTSSYSSFTSSSPFVTSINGYSFKIWFGDPPGVYTYFLKPDGTVGYSSGNDEGIFAQINSNGTVEVTSRYYKSGHVYSGYLQPFSSPSTPTVTAVSTISASYTVNPSYTVSNTQTGTLPFIIVIDETAAGGSGGNNNKHDTARDAAISALQLGLAGKLLTSVTQSSSDTGEEGGDTNVSADVSGIRAAVNSIKDWLDTTFETFTEVCTQFFTDVRLFFADFWTNFTTKLKEVFKTSLETIQDLLGNIKTGISSVAEAIKTAVSTAADTIGGKIDSIGTKISDWWEEWRSSKNDKPTSFFGSGFNSIWHYVVEWLSYIGGFLSLVLNVWSVLPYGMVVPVYAAVVLILYFGIYRKFIK